MCRWVSFEGVISFRFGKFVLHDISMAQGSLEVAKEVTLTDVNKMDWYQSAIQNITEKTYDFFTYVQYGTNKQNQLCKTRLRNTTTLTYMIYVYT